MKSIKRRYIPDIKNSSIFEDAPNSSQNQQQSVSSNTASQSPVNIETSAKLGNTFLNLIGQQNCTITKDVKNNSISLNITNGPYKGISINIK